MTVAAHDPTHTPRPVPDRTPAGIRRCLLPEDVAVFDEQLRAACRAVADEGVARLDVLQDLLRQWYTITRFSLDPAAERRRRTEEQQIEAGTYTGGVPWEDLAARWGLTLDENGLPTQEHIRHAETGEVE